MSTYPLYDSTFQLFRLSALYDGSSPVLDNLNLHARKLKGALNGDSSLTLSAASVLDDRKTGLGNLKSCSWGLLGDEAQWQRSHEEEDDDDEISMAGEVSKRDARGIHIELEYDRAKQCALMLGEPNRRGSISGFTNLPLLLVSMPVPIREIFFKYLTTTFDCRISPMKLRSSFVSSSLEQIVAHNTAPGEILKGIQLQLSFPSVAPSLKSIDFSITKDDLADFLNRGEKLWDKDSTTAMQSGSITGAFTAAFSTYVLEHLALNFDHPGVVISRFAYGPFAVSGDGKVKVLAPSDAARDFWAQVIQEASNREFYELATTKVQDRRQGTTRNKALRERANFNPMSRSFSDHRLPTEPPPPYELHDPAKRSNR